jgi:choline kinase
VRGIVLAAGGGTRLRPLTDALPKTLLPVDGDRTILELAVANLAAVDVRDVTVVTGHAAETIDRVVPDYAERYGVDVHVRFNERYDTANNAYSLWLTRDLWADGALMVNGDTVHPASVEQRLLSARDGADLVLAIDQAKPLADEEMKVALTDDGLLRHISKGLDPTTADGEYIGVTLIEPTAGTALASALEDTFERDPSRWYEDGFQEFVDRGGAVRGVAIGEVAWVEVDDHDDLARARSL